MTGADFAPALLGRILRHAEKCWPEECCGLVLADSQGALRFLEVANVAGSAAARKISARSGRDGYVMDPAALLGALDQVDREGGTLGAIVHSHPEVGAYFSKEDRDMAMGGGVEPLWPGVAYLVVSCRGGRADDARLYSWDAIGKRFREEQISVST